MSEVKLHKVSELLRHHYNTIPRKIINRYNIELLHFSNNTLFPISHDVVFVGSDHFMIMHTTKDTYYVRPVRNTPFGRERHIDGRCHYGGYFNSFKEALDTAKEWLLNDAIQLPICIPPGEDDI